MGTLSVVICVCVSQRFRYNRKLRAATTTAFGSQAASDIIIKTETVVPNTNRHAMEGSNPVWMTGVGYDNWEVEGEEGDNDVIVPGKPMGYDNFDSLDANVLNDSYEESVKNTEGGVQNFDNEEDEMDVPSLKRRCS